MQFANRMPALRLLRAVTKPCLGAPSPRGANFVELPYKPIIAGRAALASSHLAAIDALRVVELPCAVDLTEILPVCAVNWTIGVRLAPRFPRAVRRAAAEAAFAAARRGLR